MKTETIIKFSNNTKFDLKNMIGSSVVKFYDYIKSKGFKENTKSLNDYTWNWENDDLNITITAKTDHIDCEELDNEIIVDVWYYYHS
jgi:hypothetical protein